MKTIASLPASQVNELLERLKKLAIPAETRIVPYPSGVEMVEILVEHCYYDGGCEAAEAWNEERAAKLVNETAPFKPTAKTGSKWPLFWAFCSAILLVAAADHFRDHHTLRAVIDLLSAIFSMMKAVREQNDAYQV